MRSKHTAKLVLAAGVCMGVAAVGAPPLVSAGAAETLAPVVVSTAGDIACGTKVAAYNNGNGTATQCRQKYTAQLLQGSDAVWTLGDHVYPLATTSQFNAAYTPTWGQYKEITYPTPGDHDYGSTGGRDYFTYFGRPAYYSFDLGDWHVISLDSEIDHSAGSAQEQWLRADLAAHTSSCVAAYWGEPRWTSGKKAPGNSSFDPFWQDLYAAHADLVLSGDTHNYERFATMNPQGTAVADGLREFVVGTGGRNLVGFPYVQPNSQKRVKAFGVLKLTLQAGSYSWQFVDETTTVRDSGTASCV
jgi:acid phosphatase type 7